MGRGHASVWHDSNYMLPKTGNALRGSMRDTPPPLPPLLVQIAFDPSSIRFQP